MKRAVKLYLDDISEAVSKILEYTADLDREDFGRDIKTQDAVVRRLEIIGEATKCIPVAFRKRYPLIPWRRMAGLRDVLIHGYFGIELEKVWEVIEVELPKLNSQLIGLLEKEKRD
jgi:uncharacterized protein with HEPN domain